MLKAYHYFGILLFFWGKAESRDDAFVCIYADTKWSISWQFPDHKFEGIGVPESIWVIIIKLTRWIPAW